MLFNVAEQVVQRPLEIVHIDCHGTFLFQRNGLHDKAGLHEPYHSLTQQLLHEDDSIVRLLVHFHLRRGKHQKITEQFVGQFLQLPRLVPAGTQISSHLLLVLVLFALQKIQIAHQRRQRCTNVVRNRRNQAAVGRPGILLTLHPLNDGAAHALHRPCQLTDLVGTVAVDNGLPAALFHPLHLPGQTDDRTGHAAVISHCGCQQGHAGNGQRQNDHQIVIRRFGKLHQTHPEDAVGKLQTVITILIRTEIGRLSPVHRQKIIGCQRRLKTLNGHTGIVAIGLQNGSFAPIECQINILPRPRPDFQRLGIIRCQVIFLHIAVQILHIIQFPLCAGLRVKIITIEQPTSAGQ